MTCPVCHHHMTAVSSDGDSETGLMCGYCTYSCLVPSDQPPERCCGCVGDQCCEHGEAECST